MVLAVILVNGAAFNKTKPFKPLAIHIPAIIKVMINNKLKKIFVFRQRALILSVVRNRK